MTHAQAFIENFIAAVDFEEPTPVDMQTVLASLADWDSLAALAVTVMFDIEYGKPISGEDLIQCKTVEDLFLLVG